MNWELLDNHNGNSNAAHRIAVLRVCVQVPGEDRICLVLGDHVFVGHYLFKRRKENYSNFVMRLPKHHQLTYPGGHRQTIASLRLRQLGPSR